MQIYNIFKKEWKILWVSPIMYIFLILYIALTNYLFFSQFFLVGQATMRDYFSIAPWILLFFIPALTMRSWSEEKSQGTIETLFTFPIRDRDAIIGKFLGIISVVIIAIAFSVIIPLALWPAGVGFDIGRIFAGILGILFLSLSITALGLTISLTTNNQIVSFLLTICLAFMLFIIGQPFFLYSMPEIVRGLVQELSVGWHYGIVSKGLLTLKDLVYFGSFIFFFYKVHLFLLKDRN